MTENNIKKFNAITLAILSAMIVIMVGLLIYKGTGESTTFNFLEKHSVNYKLNDWKCDGETITTPHHFEGLQSGDIIRVSTVLPADLPDNYSIMFNSSYFCSRIYVDGTLVGEHNVGSYLLFSTVAGNAKVITELPADSAGKILEIEYEVIYSTKTAIPNVFCNTKDGLILCTVTDNFGLIFFFSLFLVTTITLVITGVVRFAKFKDYDRLYLFLSFAAFVLIVTLWVFANSDFPQFYLDNNVLITTLRYVMLVCIGIPYLNVCKAFLHKGQRLLSVIKGMNIILAIVIVSLFLGGIVPLQRTLIFTHSMDVFIGVTSLVLAIMEWRKYKESRMLIHGMGFFVFCVTIGMHLYYRFPTEKYSTYMSCLGLLIYIASLFLLLLKQELHYYEEHKIMDIYRDMAYSDKLTGCGNRAALERLLESFPDEENVLFIMVDINRLKKVNDCFGHDAGDEMIKGAAKCFMCTINSIDVNSNAEVFRLGGDEFVIVLWGKAYMFGEFCEALDKQLDEFNRTAKHRLSVAKGYAETRWNSSTSSFAELYRNADMMMYADKEIAHSKENTVM